MRTTEKMIAEMECQYHAMGKALPELKAAVSAYEGLDLVNAINEIGTKYGLLK